MRALKLLIGLCIGIIGISFFIPVQLKAVFDQNETYIPKQLIRKEVSDLKNIRLIQLTNWQDIKTKTINKYPMIKDIKIKWNQFPKLKSSFTKKPWVLLLKDENQYLYSMDGTLLNQNIVDVEIPDENIIIVNIERHIELTNKLDQHYISILKSIITEVDNVPGISCQKIIIQEKAIQLLTKSGIMIEIGNISKIKEKFTSLKYFLGYYRKKFQKQIL